jgi:mRNA-degrading endonuclease RelE of RelBE toxin-antitoxin system
MDYDSTPEFDDQFLKLTKKNKALEARLLKKINQILDNPLIGDPKRRELKHARGSHIDPYVIVYGGATDIHGCIVWAVTKEEHENMMARINRLFPE